MGEQPDTEFSGVHGTLRDHIDAALEHAEDESAVFNLRHARQPVVDVAAVVGGRERAGETPEHDHGTGV